jgi:DHA3 family macrolide efflux protein-like MFS transporter
MGEATREPSSAPGPKWRARFFTIWTGQTFSLVGSSLVRFALIWWLTESTGSATVLAMANLAAFVPIVVLGPFMGVIVDRWSRRWIMAVADGAVALLTLVLAVLFWQDLIQVWHVYLLLFLRAVGEGLHEPAMAASTTMLVPREHLTRVAGANQTRRSLTFLAGPVLGALVMQVLPIQAVLAIDVATALPAILPLLFLDVPQPAVSSEQAAVSGWQVMLRDTGEGLRYIWGWRGLFVLFCSISLIVFFQRPAVSMVPLLVTEHFGGGPVEMGWLSGAWQVSSVLSGLAISAWGGFRRRVVNMIVALVVYGIVALVRGLAPADAFWFVVAASVVGGLATPMFFASMQAMLQSTVPSEMQGRVFALQNSMTMGMGPLGLVILGPLADVIGVQPLFVMTGVSALLVAGVWLLIPSVRRVEDGPQ